MKERPILFNGPMVRAILDCSKTQTRRIVKVRGNREDENPECGFFPPCPYGEPGDHLWVRETFALSVVDPDGGPPEDDPENYDVIYRATDTPGGGWTDGEGNTIAAPWKPSIHMPRWASRILLEITGVRVERLQDISASDARAEGVESHEVRQFALFGLSVEERAEIHRQAAVGPYQGLWETINGAGSWDTNPWVWVVEFKRMAP